MRPRRYGTKDSSGVWGSSARGPKPLVVGVPALPFVLELAA